MKSGRVCRRWKGQSFQALLGSASERFQPVQTRSDEAAMLIYTSGTTGPPKGALNGHRCLLGNLPGFELSQNFYPREQDLMWTPADWAWTGGLLDALLPALHYGVPVLGHVGGRFDPEHACRLMGKYGVRNAFIPPTAMKMLMQVESPKQKHGLRLRSIMSAGEQVGTEVVRWAREELDVGVNEMWGQTEFNYLVGNCAQIMAVRPGSMGKPYPGHNVEPVDTSGKPMPDGEVGELAARRDDPVFFLGYWGQEKATREKFVGDYWGTGDLGYRDSDGYLWFVGRKDDVISSAGHRIGPGEIEDCLIKHEAVAQAAVVGSPDELRGEIVKAFIILAEGQTPSQTLAQSIQQNVKQRLAAHEYPREIEFVDSLPMTTTGKVRRIELREREIERKRDG
jgi:acetyl-CoA synthetase